ncbi:MAG: hypothetical protein ACI87L_001354, partial [Litorivivens sp.]
KNLGSISITDPFSLCGSASAKQQHRFRYTLGLQNPSSPFFDDGLHKLGKRL